ncbi:hypothetical protein K2173_028296 [Erythroxylum novogranatense]|uniref:Glycosyltransferase 61 catalytic domain-containing protein n=1 Tax=Erythroxylum novogranatense TaxID=1862640 RepID=A0AAV8U4H1_9ROSI|nr:hypothetical protein K2173_028296 [Erythroxylum novogranatense]
MKLVKSWSIAREKFPHCSIKHSVAAILFSLGGFSGNHFHDFTDLLIPLYLTSTQFKGEVQFLVTDNRPWWIIKFKRILEKMSRYEIIDMDREEKIHCYSHVIVGLKSHKELSIDPSKSPAGLSMTDFRHLLRKTYSLKRHTVAGLKQKKDKRRRLMIISRRSSRALTNERRISKMAKSIGYEVVVAEASLATDLSRFAQLVNSCDVLMGVHGAGLTNMVFLPDNAIVIQILPLGEIDGLARDDFKEPAKDMNLRYLEYKIKRKESSLAKLYSPDNAILTDPLSVHRGGWDAVKSTYMEKQNVKLDLHRFKFTLIEAFELLCTT